MASKETPDEFEFNNGTNAHFIEDDDSTRSTLVITKEVEGKEMNFAIDFSSHAELISFTKWLESVR